MVCIKQVNMQNFKLLTFMFLGICRHKNFCPEGNESSRYDIYPLESSKIREKSVFMPENLFFIPKLYPPAFPWFSSETKSSYLKFLKRFKNSYSNPPGELILLTFCQNATND